MGGKTTAQWDQDSFAWYADTGGEGTGKIGATNANPSTLVTGTQYRLRYLIQETAGSNQAETPVFEMEYRVDAAGGTSFGSWLPIDSDDSYFTAVSSANVTDGATTTQQIGGGTFNDGEFSYVDATSRAPTNAMAATAGSDEYECEWVLNFSTAAAGANFEFRVTRDTGTTLDTTTNTTQVLLPAADSTSAIPVEAITLSPKIPTAKLDSTSAIPVEAITLAASAPSAKADDTSNITGSVSGNTDPDITSSAGWTLTDVTITGGKAVMSGAAGSQTASPPGATNVVNGRTYYYKIEATGYSAGIFQVQVGGAATAPFFANGVYSGTLTATADGTPSNTYLIGSSAAVVDIEYLIIREATTHIDLVALVPTAQTQTFSTSDIPLENINLAALAPAAKADDVSAIPAEAITLSPFAPTAKADDISAVPLEAVTLAALAPSAKADDISAVPLEAVTLTALAPTAILDSTSAIPVEAITLASNAPTAKADDVASVPAEAITLSGLAPTAILDSTSAVPLATITLSGIAPTAKADDVASVPVEAITLSALVPTAETTTGDSTSAVPVEAITLSPNAPTAILDDTSDIPLATIALAGAAPTAKSDDVSAIPIEAITLSALIPTAETTAGDNTSDIPAATIQLTTNNPSAVADDVSIVPLANISLIGNVPTAIDDDTLAVRTAPIILSANAPTATLTEVAYLPPPRTTFPACEFERKGSFTRRSGVCKKY